MLLSFLIPLQPNPFGYKKTVDWQTAKNRNDQARTASILDRIPVQEYKKTQGAFPLILSAHSPVPAKGTVSRKNRGFVMMQSVR